MPPIRQNPKFLKHREIASEQGISQANILLQNQFRAETILEASQFKDWILAPLQLLRNAYSFVIVGGLIYFYINSTKGNNKNLFTK